jgi:thioredoxin reductase
MNSSAHAGRSQMVVLFPSGQPLASTATCRPSGTGVHVPADPMGATEVAAVWVAGNVTDPSAQVITAAAQGTRAGAAVNADLVAEDAALARAGV